LTNAVVAHWSLENPNFDVMDYLGFALTNFGSTVVAGKVGNAGLYDGGDYTLSANTLNDPRLVFPSVYSVSIWATEKSGRSAGSPLFQTRHAFGGNPIANFGYATSAGLQELSSALWNASFVITQSCAFGGGAPSADVWHMYTAVINTLGPTYQVLYLDGAAVTPNCTGLTAGAVATTNITTFVIGAGEGTIYNGTIDEVSYFSRAITQTEISCLYNSGNGRAWPWEGC
jgi:hypothetical protein